MSKNDGKIIGNTIIDLSVLELKFETLYELLLKKEVITMDEFNDMLEENAVNINDIVKAKMDLTRILDEEIK